MTPERVAAFNARASQNEQLVGRTIYAAGFTWPGVMFWDDIRTVDYLLTRPEVDPKRIGCVGLSVGGLRSATWPRWTTGSRRRRGRLDGLVPGAAQEARPQHHRPHQGGAGPVPPPGLPGRGVAGHAGPLLVINGSQDGLFDLDGVKASFAKLAACYEKAGVPERCRTRLYDTPHEFNAEMQAEAWAWLEKLV